MISVFIGARGSGKTLSMTIDAYKKYKQGYRVYSNYHLNFPYTPYTVDDLLMFAESGMQFNDCCFLCDEAHIFFDSYQRGRRAMIFSYLLNQSSKMNMDWMFSTQFARQIFIRIRLNAEIVVESTAKVVLWKTKDSRPVIVENYRKKPHDYHTEVYIYNRIIKFSDSGYDKVIKRMYKANRYFKLYDTREVVKQQSDMFQRAKLMNKDNNDVRIPTKLTYKEKRAEQHVNRLFHEQNARKVLKQTSRRVVEA